MQKRTIILTSMVVLLSGLFCADAYSGTKQDNQLQKELNASKIAFQAKEQEYRQEIDLLRQLLRKDRSSRLEQNSQILKIVEANKKLTDEQTNLLTLKNEVKTLQAKVKDVESNITKADMPDLNDTSKITNIDIDVINDKFKNGALRGQGKLLVETALKYNISPHFFVALIALESGNGKSKLARNKNNFGGIRSSKRGYRSFSSKKEGLNYIAELIQRKYHGEGLVSLTRIQKRYAPSWDGNKNWDGKIRSIMKQLHYEALS